VAKRERKRPPSSTLSASGCSRRRFLERSALAAVAGTTAVLARPAGAAAAEAATPACPQVPTPMRQVAGKVAFITGGDSGIGLGVARAFTDAGMKVVITYRTQAHLDEAMKYLSGAHDRVHAIGLDVTDRAAMQRAADEAVQVFGKVHVLVANAGVALIGGLSSATYDDWDWGMGVNVGGVFNAVHCLLPRIRAHGEGGQVVATSSLAGIIAHGGAGVYSASKFAVVGMMEALRNELLDSNIGVSVFCPGLVNTNIGTSNRNRPSNLADSGFKPDPKMLEGMRKQMQAMRGPPPGMAALEAGQRVLAGMRDNDMYILTTPEFAPEIQARGEAIVASLPSDVNAPAARIAVGRMLVGKTVYAIERDRKRCERARAQKT